MIDLYTFVFEDGSRAVLPTEGAAFYKFPVPVSASAAPNSGAMPVQDRPDYVVVEFELVRFCYGNDTRDFYFPRGLSAKRRLLALIDGKLE